MTKETDEARAARFWRRVDKGPREGGCWLWRGAVDGFGYGWFAVDRKMRRAHRVSWAMTRGEIGGLLVLHKCDVPACVNPDHLFLGTNKDNSDDKVAKGRQHRPRPERTRGEKSPGSRLTDAQAAEIVRRYQAGGVSQTALAREFGVTQGAVSLIVNGKVRGMVL